MTVWYPTSARELEEKTGTSLESGLTSEQAKQRAVEHGPNVIQQTRGRSLWRILFAQFTDFMVLTLLAAAIIAGFLGEPQDIVAILVIVLLNATLGFTQEYRAEKAMAALRALAAPHARVRRQGHVLTVPAFELVPGDIVILEGGNLIPADIRLTETHQLTIDESALTGESIPVGKITEAIREVDLPIGDQRNMAFKGTMVSTGRGVGVVVRTGMETELGRIARLLHEEVEVRTPLQERITKFARRLALIVIALCAVIFVTGLARGEDPVLMFMTALSLAVAAIPEALPAVVTVSLAIGARRMIQRESLIRKLPAVETLGSVTYICSDKTGTLTQNRMTVRSLFSNGEVLEAPLSSVPENQAWRLLMQMQAQSNDAFENAKGEVEGDPTETALFHSSAAAGFYKAELEKLYPRIAEIPFSSERGLMSTVHAVDETRVVFTKGAPERVLPLCEGQLLNDRIGPFDELTTREISDRMAVQGLRVLAFAYRVLENRDTPLDLEETERALIFVGLSGMMDPPRPEVKRAIETCQHAGISVTMITGDHPTTAQVIARDLGLLTEGRMAIVSGQKLNSMTDDELKASIESIPVFARVAPEQKIRIVKALQENGEITAMTGDGVNDAPALRRANIGIAMGKGGTDVAREAAHMVLLDDNFTTIVSAVREGRRIYDNIRKFVRFALSGNSGEIWTLFLAPFLGLPTPLLPIHILWVNLVTDGLPGLALAVEPEERSLMDRPPRAPNESLFAHGLWQHTLWVGLLIGGLTLFSQWWALSQKDVHWQSITFTVLTFTQMFHVMAIRSERDSLFSQGVFSNPYLLGSVLFTFLIQLSTLYVPFMQEIFRTAPLSASDLAFCVAISSLVFVAVEIEKWIRRRRTVA